MNYPPDPRRDEAEAMPIEEVAERLELLGGLRRNGQEFTGPCPNCGGRDRFSINTQKGVFLCRRCDGKGGGVGLVMFVMNLTFPQALEYLCGPRQEVDPAELARREKVRAQEKAKRDAREAKERAVVIREARRAWADGQDSAGSLVAGYLDLRGIRLASIPPTLRFAPNLAFTHKIDGKWVTLHRGPAMLAQIKSPDGLVTAVHRTWLDLSQPKGKAVIRHPETGEILPSKKVLGSKKGGAIRLTAPSAGVMVMGEGLETTLTALAHDAVPGAAYWCGIDLGNMSGSRETGKGLRFAGLPRMDDAQAFVPPEWVKRLIFIQDGDSEARDTRAKLLAGLRRAMVLRPGLQGQIVHAGEGVDLNDLVMGKGTDDEQG
jgi:hypothetical protein